MEFDDQEASSNVEDRRGFGPVGFGGIGLGGIAILVMGYFLGVDPSQLLDIAQQVPVPQQEAPARRAGPVTDEMGHFVAQVLGSTEQVWGGVFEEKGGTCLRTRFHAPGSFPEAYVIAHEVGHHVQKLMGISDRTDQLRGHVSRAEFNRASVRLELQADCFAGVWANRAVNRARITDRDIEQGLTAASAIGDDRLQRESRGYVVPESFTHGSSGERVRWFKRGIESGRVGDCNTFATRSL
jgi:predicted metalloprotease